MSILNRNRKPINDQVVMVDGVPHRILSKPDRNGRFEAVDPWGNQVVMEEYAGSLIPVQPYIGKMVFHLLRTSHPDIADSLDTDYDVNRGYKTPSGEIYDLRRHPDRDYYLERTRVYRKNRDGTYRLEFQNGSLRSMHDYYQALQGVENMGYHTEPIDDPATGSYGTRLIYYYKPEQRWYVEDWVQTQNMGAFLAKPDPGFTKPRSTGKKASGSNNIRGRGRR